VLLCGKYSFEAERMTNHQLRWWDCSCTNFPAGGVN
jgi:hypothetical protein